MKRIITLMAFAAFYLSVFAQSPNLMTYQAVLRDANNQLITSQSVAVQISIIQGAPNNASIYSEVHALSTNANGLISLEIGAGVTSDDLSLIDWSAGPFFLKSETDPGGGNNYSITSTSQLLSVPYAKYADKAGNVFSGDYGDLAGAPTNVGAFANDEGYITGVNGSEPAFDDWDKNVLDDFSGDYDDLSGAPTNVSHFSNDAGYLTSASGLWSQNGNNLYYNDGVVGIGMSNPSDIHLLTLHGGAGDSWLKMYNNVTGTGQGQGLLIGVTDDPDPIGLFWNYAGGLSFGVNGLTRMYISPGGDVAIGTGAPRAALDVRGGTNIGPYGKTIYEIQEVTGSTSNTYYTTITLPGSYNESNTRVMSLEINYGGDRWVGLGFNYQVSPGQIHNVSYMINGSTMYIYYPNIPELWSRSFRAMIMWVDP